MNAALTDKEYYLTTWVKMLHGLLGWSKADVLQWSRKSAKLNYLDNPNDALYHESPVYWAVDLLIPDALWRELAPLQRVLIRRDLLQALDHGQQYTIPQGTDWNSYADKVEQVLGRFGASLPRSRRLVIRSFQGNHTLAQNPENWRQSQGGIKNLSQQIIFANFAQNNFTPRKRPKRASKVSLVSPAITRCVLINSTFEHA
ncbi:MAG: hypothetical protein M3Y28_00150 [Armatimonadota bacterium]|nr:hypothetical protein [Armatimonadota bacterium]